MNENLVHYDARPRRRQSPNSAEAPALPQDLQALRCEEPDGRREVPKVPEQEPPSQEARAQALGLAE